MSSLIFNYALAGQWESLVFQIVGLLCHGLTIIPTRELQPITAHPQDFQPAISSSWD